MILAWRRQGNNGLLERNLSMELTIPSHFICPISLDLMKDPVTVPTGITYDRESIGRWIDSGNPNCPVTNQPLGTADQIPNHALRRMIQDWCVANHTLGIERVPTPRIPVTPNDVVEICKKITSATQRGSRKTCLALVQKINAWARESERNKNCIVDSGTGRVLSSSFEHFAYTSFEENEEVLGEILSLLTWTFPLGVEGQSKLGAFSSLRCMAEFLHGEDLTKRKNAVSVLKQLLSLDQKHANAFAEIGGIEASLFQIVNEQNCPKTTKAALMIIHHTISLPSRTSDKIILRFLDLGIVTIVLEILVGGNRSISEKALFVLNDICSCREGLEKARGHALTMPVLAKKMLRVSITATELSVFILWKLCRNGSGPGIGQLLEALQLGAFEKMVVVLQVGCGDRTKEMATQLLKLLNQHRGRLNCVDLPVDFMHLQNRPTTGI